MFLVPNYTLKVIWYWVSPCSGRENCSCSDLLEVTSKQYSLRSLVTFDSLILAGVPSSLSLMFSPIIPLSKLKIRFQKYNFSSCCRNDVSIIWFISKSEKISSQRIIASGFISLSKILRVLMYEFLKASSLILIFSQVYKIICWRDRTKTICVCILRSGSYSISSISSA